jgi:hypothetical protein
LACIVAERVIISPTLTVTSCRCSKIFGLDTGGGASVFIERGADVSAFPFAFLAIAEYFPKTIKFIIIFYY